jgi:hypothetical protein
MLLHRDLLIMGVAAGVVGAVILSDVGRADRWIKRMEAMYPMRLGMLFGGWKRSTVYRALLPAIAVLFCCAGVALVILAFVAD